MSRSASWKAGVFSSRQPDPTDGRRILLSITASGKREVNRRRDARVEQLTAGLTGFSAAELAQLAAAAPLIERLAQRLQMTVDEHAAETRDNCSRWVALTNTYRGGVHVRAGRLDRAHRAAGDLPGVHLDPLAPANITYLLRMIMGYRLVQAVLVVTVGRIGDMFGRVRVYNLGFTVFTVASVLLSVRPVRRGPPPPNG